MVINQAVVVALNIKLIEQTQRIWAELKELGRDYGEWTYGTLRDGDFTCGVRIPSSLAQSLKPGQTGWWTGTFETTTRREDSRARMSQYDAWRFVARNFEAQGMSDRFFALQQTEQQMIHEGILPRQSRLWPNVAPPWHIGIVGQLHSKGLEDVETKLKDAADLTSQVFPVEIGKVASVVDGIQRAGRDDTLTAIMIVRGGGDLEIFDQAPVIRALAQLSTFSITGIGHSTDRVLSNAVVDYAATTPTDAALYVLGKLAARREKQALNELTQRNHDLQEKLTALASKKSGNTSYVMWILIGVVVVLILLVAFKG